MINVEIKVTRPGAMIPEPATDMAAGLDLMACIDEPIEIWPGADAELIPSGIAISIMTNSHAAILIPRSGLGHKHGIILGNGTGLIDGDYQGEVFISVYNRGNIFYTIQPGERIAQMVFIPVERAGWDVVTEFGAKTERGTGGFGHSGR